MTRHEMAAAELSAALAVGIDPFAYRGGIVAPAGFLEGGIWALNNMDTTQREADERELTTFAWSQQRHQLLLKHLGPQWDIHAVDKAFRKSETEVGQSRDREPLEPYTTWKAQITSREIDFSEAIHRSQEHLAELFMTHLDLDRESIAGRIAAAKTSFRLLRKARFQLLGY